MSDDTITAVLQDGSLDGRAAVDRLVPLVYGELRRLAHSVLAREHHSQTLVTTDLVHEAYLKLVDHAQLSGRSRRYFFGAAARDGSGSGGRRTLPHTDQARRRTGLRGAPTRAPRGGRARRRDPRSESSTRTTTVRSDTPAALARLIDRCLEKDPNHRYQGMREVIAELRRVQSEMATGGARWARAATLSAGAAAAIVLSLISSGPPDVLRNIRSGSSAAESMVPVRHRLAVLPLVNRTAGSLDAHVAETMTDEIVARLSGLEGLEVVGRQSATVASKRPSGDLEMARLIRAESLLTGTVHGDASQLDINLRLRRVSSGAAVWSREYRSPSRDVELVHRSMRQEIAEVLSLPVRGAERLRVGGPETVAPEAYTAYLQGQYFGGKRDKTAFDRARHSFEQAIDRAPTFARAWAGLAGVYALLGSYSWMPPVEAHGRARKAAEEALNLDEGVAEAHAVLGSVLADYYWDRDAAERHLRRAIELDPGNANAHQCLSEHLWSVGRFGEAITEAKRAKELDPLSLPAQLAVGHAFYMARRFDDARAEYERILGIEPEHTLTYFYLGLTYLRQGHHADALRAFEQIDDLTGYAAESVTGRGVVHAHTGPLEESRQMLVALEELATKQQVSPFYAARIHVALDEVEHALELLARGADERSWLVRLLKGDPRLDPLRSDPRFRSLVERVGLGERQVSVVPSERGE